MRLKILNGVWDIIVVDDEDVLAHTQFPQRSIYVNVKSMLDLQMFKHCIIHELVHAYQAEIGQWQNVIGNGRSQDDFDSEFIAEFVAIYATDILSNYELLKEELWVIW